MHQNVETALHGERAPRLILEIHCLNCIQCLTASLPWKSYGLITPPSRITQVQYLTPLTPVEPYYFLLYVPTRALLDPSSSYSNFKLHYKSSAQLQTQVPSILCQHWKSHLVTGTLLTADNQLLSCEVPVVKNTWSVPHGGVWCSLWRSK